MPDVKKKIIFLNASTVKISGGLIQALVYLETIILSKKYVVYISCPKIPEYKEFEGKNARIKYVPDFLLNKIFRWLLDYFWVPKKIKAVNPDMVLTLGNMPAITLFYQIYLHDNPYLTNDIPKSLHLSFPRRFVQSLRVSLTKNRLKYANEIWVQTQLERKLISTKTNFSGIIKTVFPLLPLHLSSNNTFTKTLPNKAQGTIRLICLSNYFEHKNIEILVDLIKLSSEKNFNIQILFTLDNNNSKKCSKLIREINALPDTQAMNIGKIASNNITSVIEQCDGVILPSLLETFGLNSLEAWYCKKPYFISSLPWAKEVCGVAAIYISPFSAREISKELKAAFSNPEKLTQVVDLGCKKIDLWPETSTILFEIENSLSNIC